MLGWEPVWASEIEPYPVAVTKARFPNMLHLGDITKIDGAEVAPVDVIVGGSPCQDLSVAGKQAGLHGGSRSHLFFQMTRIVREMRAATNGEYPRFVVWENVPGAFSSNQGRDFLAVVEEFCHIADSGVHIPEPERDKTGQLVWRNAGAVVGSGWSFAWRIVDAQYWGVPQRRRRIYAVLDLGSECAGEVLFERACLPWNTEPRGEAGQGTASDVVGRADGGGGVVGAFCAGAAPAAGSIGYSERVAPTLKAGQCALPMGAVVYEPMSVKDENWAEADAKNALRAGASKSSHAVVYPVGAVGSLCARADSSPCIDRGQPFVAYESGQGYWMPGFGCLRAEGENRPSRPSHAVIAIQGDIARGAHMRQNGIGHSEDGSRYTLNTIDVPAVAFRQISDGEFVTDESASTLRARTPRDRADVICMESAQANAAITEDLAPCLNASHEQPVLCGQGKPPRRYIVRRLMPVECARLQGFPDWWVDGVKGSDSAIYKMYGNGMALPNMLAVLNGIDYVRN